MALPPKAPKTSLHLEHRSSLRPYAIAAAIGLAFGLAVSALGVLLIR
jgi:hypothetical protein